MRAPLGLSQQSVLISVVFYFSGCLIYRRYVQDRTHAVPVLQRSSVFHGWLQGGVELQLYCVTTGWFPLVHIPVLQVSDH